MRKLAHIEKIEWKRPIQGADKIELVGVLGWCVIAKKDEFNVGDLCVYIEIDSIVDSANHVFSFLESKHYKIKTMKMRGVISQGIVFPISAFGYNPNEVQIGQDVTDALKIKKIEDEPPSPIKFDKYKELQNRYPNLYKSRIFRFFMKFKWFKRIVYSIVFPKTRGKHGL